ncbi:MAG: hypothetical protein E6R03_13725 [Hyphomicrobiaceae bacterium]|nr:MAG: hypothetical protein E6R03_13725 [Hyphomicrobiaceae bacterium]
MRNQCYIMIGCSGSGKSTVTKEHSLSFKGSKTTLVVSADNYQEPGAPFNVSKLEECHERCLHDFVEFVAESEFSPEIDHAIYVDNTNTRLEEIIPYYRVARAFGYDVTLIYVNTDIPVQVAFERNKHGTPRDTISAQLDRISRLQIPHYIKRSSVVIDNWRFK